MCVFVVVVVVDFATAVSAALRLFFVVFSYTSV